MSGRLKGRTTRLSDRTGPAPGKAGLDVATIRAMGGWKTRAMAERYTHAASMRDAMDTLQNRLSGRRWYTEIAQAQSPIRLKALSGL